MSGPAPRAAHPQDHIWPQLRGCALGRREGRLIMNLAELQDYSKWVGKNAEDVLRWVISRGGWINVFPSTLPKWASRIRNYFNITPSWFHRVDSTEARALIDKHSTHRSLSAWWALSGDVYRDEESRVWFDMHTV